MSPQDAESVVAQGIGVTNIVARATARADELSRDELEAGAQRLRRLVSRRKPEVVAIAGITAYRMAFDRPRATVGRQPGELAGAQLWVVPNPSGLNAHASLDSLAEDYRAVGVAAGILSIP
jgi:TDG/mug DNA glycosylase family protein